MRTFWLPDGRRRYVNRAIMDRMLERAGRKFIADAFRLKRGPAIDTT
jgi:hypothetical protein